MSHGMYSDAYDGLPITAPIGCPHVIKLGPHIEQSFYVQDMRLADGIATLLYHYHPDLLTKFLDPSIVEFKFGRKDLLKGDFVLERMGRYIRCVKWINSCRISVQKMEVLFTVDELAGFWTPRLFAGELARWHRLVDEDSVVHVNFHGAKLCQEIMLSEYWKTGIEIEFYVNVKSA